MFNIGPQELLILLVVALVIVGPKRLPELGRTIGRGLNEFRKLQDEVKDMVKFDLNEDPVFPADRSYDEPAAAEPDETQDGADELADERSHSERVIAAMQDDAEPEPLPDVAADTPEQEPEPEDDSEPGSPAGGVAE
jgi:sec-independent protein translocase protein TatA